MTDQILQSSSNKRLSSNVQQNINNVIFQRQNYRKIIKRIDDLNNENLSNIIISGYAGYGKSELIKALSVKCIESGHLVLKGKFEQLNINTPYQTLKNILSTLQYVGNDDEIKSAIIKLKGNISKEAFNSFYSMCEDLFKHLDIEVKAEGYIENKELFYNAIYTFLNYIASKQQHIFIVFDDMQWCDNDTRELLTFFVDKDFKYIHIVFGYRSNELSNEHSTEELIKIYNDDFAYKDTVEGFSDVECKEYIKEYIGLDLSDEFIFDINNRSQGNPFFIKQILTSVELEKSYDSNGPGYYNEDVMFSSGTYRSLDFYIKRNLKFLSSEYLNIIKLLSCIGKPIDMSVVSLIIKLPIEDIRDCISSTLYYKYIVEVNDNLLIEHDKISQLVYESLSIKERQEKHAQIYNGLLAENKNKYLFDIVSHLKESTVQIKNNEIMDVARLYVDAADKSLSQQAYKISNLYYKNAFDFINQHYEYFDSKLKDYSQYGYIYTAFLLGESNELLGEIDKLLSDASDIVSVSKYYALYKDIIVNSGSGYETAKNKGIQALLKFDVYIEDERINLSGLKKSIDSCDAVKACEIKIDKRKNPDELTVFSSKLMRLLLDLWEAAYYSQDIEIMELCVYKIVDISMINNMSSESSFGFAMYAMYLSKQDRYKESYGAGLLALKIVDKFDNQVMFPKITNLFCNYSAFYTERFSDISLRYYESYRVAVSTNDLLFGAWAAYFNVWTLYISGERLSVIRERCYELYPFLVKTNDKKMIMSFDIFFDFINNLLGDNKGVSSNKQVANIEPQVSEIQYFEDNLFLPGTAWQSIVYSSHYYLFGQYEKVVDDTEYYLSSMNIDIVMFPLTQIYFIECLSLIKLISSGYNDLNERLNRSLDVLSELSKNASVNFKIQYDIVQLSLHSHGLLSPKEIINIDAIVLNTKNNGTYLEIGVMYESLISYNYSRGEFSLAKEFLRKTIEIYSLWGATLKIKQLNYVYAYVLSDAAEVNKIKNKLIESDLSHILKLSLSLTKINDVISIADKLVLIAERKTKASRSCFLAVSDGEYKVLSDRGAEKTNDDLYDGTGLFLTHVSKNVVDYCLYSKTHVLLDSKNNIFNDDYLSRSNISSIMCIPLIINESVLGLLYLENSHSLFSNEHLDYFDLLISQTAAAYNNALLHDVIKLNENKHINIQNNLISKIDRVAHSHQYANIGIWEWDIITNELYWSDEIFVIFGFSQAHTVVNYEKFISVLYPDDVKKVEKAIQSSLDGEDYNIEHRIIRPDGSIKWVSESGGIIRDANKKTTKMFGVVQDISDKKEAEEKNVELNLKLTQANKMESIGQLAGGIAHDFNNMLASILGYTELTIELVTPTGDEKIIDYLRNISAAGNRAKDLIKQMLLFSRKYSYKEENVSLNPIVKESIKLLGSTIPSSMNLVTNITTDTATVSIDAIQVQQIIMNLCVNSRDAISDTGSIKVSLHEVRKLDATCDSCHTSMTGDFIELSVEDDGSGIDENNLNKIFEPFFTTKEVGQGTGMGLSVVHGIVHTHNGHIQIDSSRSGTKVSVFLPRVNHVENRVEDKSLASNNKVKFNAHIVVVDDEEFIIDYLQDLLELNGANVTTFLDSTEALDFIKNNPQDIDLLITDMTMPNLNGVNLSQQVLKISPDLPIILCTGYSPTIDEDTAHEIGVSDYLDKPINSKKLLDSINKLLVK